MDTIKPRPLFREAMRMLEAARCPECGRAFDAEQDAETYLPRQRPLNCAWCSQRVMLMHQFAAWQRQDASALPRRRG